MNTRSAPQRGLSLMSLLVALTIGTILFLGLFNIWSQTRQTFSAQALLAQLQDNEIMALTLMANTIQTGGYYPVYRNYTSPLPAGAPYSLVNSFPADTYFAAQQFISGTHPTSGSGSDALMVRFVADNTNTFDCFGQTEPTGTVVTNTYAIDANNNLSCTVSYIGSAPITQPILASTTIAGTATTRISKMTIWYSVDTTGGGTAYQYQTADKVTNWNNVRAVNIQLTFLNPLSVNGPSSQSQSMPMITRTIVLAQTTH